MSERRRHDCAEGGTRRAGDATPDDEAGGHTATQQRPGIGREEQARPQRPAYGPRPESESESDDR
ncbi:hypothetical protein [Streptomyces sp. W1SF4]|uniref:hypothetical protein n=1 Tax=Streptomyces sp. W1SF4 TaxID=2305220 RepID=UPI000F6C877E|nr:hypothetical protein [Streptomyces sp. W1SF4]AZM87418.1 hypothetical protein D1J60_01970 [Streptomyces sp. W1SF4]